MMQEAELSPSPIVHSRPFADPEQERAFRLWALEADVAFFRRVAVLVGAAFLAFFVADVPSFGVGPVLLFVTALRLVLFAIFLVIWSRLGRTSDPDELDRLTATAATTVIVIQAIIDFTILNFARITVDPSYAVTGQLITIFGIYLFLPNPIAIQRVISWFGTAAFLAVLLLGVSLHVPTTHVLGMFVLVNLLGEALARRRAAQHRAQFLSIDAEAEMNRRLRAEVERREALEQQRNRIYSMIGHDLRSPLSTMIGTTEILAEDAKDLPAEEVAILARSTHRNARVLLDLLDNLLQWGRLQMGRVRFQPARVELGGVVDKVVSLLEPTAREKHIRLTTSGLPVPNVLGDATMLATIIRNLTSNGIKFTPSGGSVRIGLRDLGDAVEVSVTDSGVGVAPEKLAGLLSETAAEVGTGTDGEPGTGLGLVISREFLSRHGSRLEAESEVGEGTTFRFRLPVAGRMPEAATG